MVYNPARTTLLQDATELGIPCANGLLMLVAQAKRACELFLGEPVSDDVIPPIVASIARQTENIVLVGMPGCGKSTIATRLADVLGRPVIDTDRMIVDAAGTDIPAIFAAEGEDGFRLREIRAVREAGKASGTVIATGGGVVTRAVNYPALHQNGRIVFLRRDLSSLPTDGRPISQIVAREELYAKRLPLYRRFADIEIDNNGAVEDTVEAILAALGYRNETEKG
jgi:shikimate dehydrogenase